MKKIILTQVNDFLQVSGHQNIFAVGDCCNTQEHKMAAFAGAHGETVARNIIKEVMGCSPTPYKRVGNYGERSALFINEILPTCSHLLVCWSPSVAVEERGCSMGSTSPALSDLG